MPVGQTYTDEQVTAATGLHVDNLRRLITWGAVRPVQAGGGRGRVRMWSTRQALRISVTAQFVEAGFSLQMAHTITYCLPLDDLLHVYDPAVLALMVARKPSPHDQQMIALLTSRKEPNSLPGEEYLGSRTVLLDGRYLYSDCLGDTPHLMAIIDQGAGKVYPTWSSPYTFQYGAGATEDLGLEPVIDATSIERSSLLIEDRFLKAGKRPKLPKHIVPPHLPGHLLGLEHVVSRTLLVLNMAVGLVMCVRKLQGLVTNYQPHEIPYND